MVSTPLVSRYYLDLYEGEDEDNDVEKEALEVTDWTKSTAMKSRFDSKHFGKACQVIRALRNPSKKLLRPIFANDEERILTYELTVSILKYASFLNQALEASDFYKRNPNYKKENNEDVLVVLYDLFERDFQVHRDDPVLSRRFALLQSGILGVRTKIMAHLARLRIQHQATTVNHLLPENLRHQKHIDQNPIYGWVNLKKTKLAIVLSTLNENGLQRSEFEDDILIQEDSYYVDAVHGDLIRFHSRRKDTISNSSLVQDGSFVVQDKSACMPVYTLAKALFFRENLNRDKKLNATANIYSGSPLKELSSSSLQGTYLGVPISIPPSEEWYENILEINKKDPKSDCVIVTHGGSGRSVAHLACLLQESVPKWLSRNTEMSARDDLATAISNKFIPRPPLTVVAFGIPVNRLEEISRFFRKQMQLNNVRLHTDDFMTVSPKDPRVKNACAILVNPPSSGSALKDPVSYICTEGGDEDVLVHLSKFVHTQTSPDTAQKYTSSQIKFLKHAFNFPQTKLVLYTTCSLLSMENSEVINMAMTDFHQEYSDHKTKTFAEIISDKKLIRSFRDINLDLVPLSQVLDTYDKSNFNGPFLEMPPSSASSGCFMAMIRRKEILINIDKNCNKFTPHTPSQEGELNLEDPFAIHILQDSSGNIDASSSGPPFLTRAGLQNSLALLRSTAGSTTNSIRSSRSAGASTNRNKKRSMTKKAILQRVTIPTHASLAKQTRKCREPRRKRRRRRQPGKSRQLRSQSQL
ncbi:unnamed protein product [Allacma fusca]|uniref:SAM-dependent MTase RsmB/NOP-type domain-containing protein n=1 Tax=Allacma fusca TaxID=39272 RepID=A0A8J2LDA3_9HEXA|nr:unnamed protein product [Allacma fusca]